MTPQELIVKALPLMVGIQEVPTNSNKGYAVERILKSVGLDAGNPWCAASVYYVGHTLLGDEWKLPKTGSCDVLLEFAKKHNILFDTPEVGCVFLLLKTPTDAVHTGWVTEVSPGECSTNEGNTNAGGSREGWGQFERTRPINKSYKYIHWWKL